MESMRLIVGCVWTDITGSPIPDVLIEKATSYLVPGHWFSPLYKKGFWDGKVKLLQKKQNRKRFPTGLLEAVTKVLDRNGWNYTIQDNRDLPYVENIVITLLDDDGNPTIKLRDYQEAAVTTALHRGRGVIVAATGAGKSEMGAAIIASVNRPTLWLTHRQNLLEQTQKRLSARLGKHVGTYGGGVYDIQDVTVCMVQTLHNSKDEKHQAFLDYLQTVEVLICDEVHHIGSNSDQWYDNVAKIPAPFRIGLTATPDFSGHGLKLLAMTGHEIYRISAQELIDRGILVPPRIFLMENEHPKIPAKTKGSAVYSEGVVYAKERNALLVAAAQHLAHERKPTLLLVRQINHGELLLSGLIAKGVKADFLHGKVGSTQRDLMVSALKNGVINCLVAQVEIMGEGVDLPWLRAIINATGNSGGGDASSEKEGQTGRNTIQIIGRALRKFPGKTYCDIVDVMDYTHASLKKASQSRLGTYVAEGHEERIYFWRDVDSIPAPNPQDVGDRG
jgi:superfamily II DNA or RNA helicase